MEAAAARLEPGGQRGTPCCSPSRTQPVQRPVSAVRRPVSSTPAAASSQGRPVLKGRPVRTAPPKSSSPSVCSVSRSSLRGGWCAGSLVSSALLNCLGAGRHSKVGGCARAVCPMQELRQAARRTCTAAQPRTSPSSCRPSTTRWCWPRSLSAGQKGSRAAAPSLQLAGAEQRGVHSQRPQQRRPPTCRSSSAASGWLRCRALSVPKVPVNSASRARCSAARLRRARGGLSLGLGGRPSVRQARRAGARAPGGSSIAGWLAAARRRAVRGPSCTAAMAAPGRPLLCCLHEAGPEEGPAVVKVQLAHQAVAVEWVRKTLAKGAHRARPVPARARERECKRSANKAAGCWLLAAGCWLLAAGCWLLAAGCRLPAAGCWLLAAGCWLPAAGCWLLAVHWPPPAQPAARGPSALCVCSPATHR
jgi:hypothetical protein